MRAFLRKWHDNGSDFFSTHLISDHQLLQFGGGGVGGESASEDKVDLVVGRSRGHGEFVAGGSVDVGVVSLHELHRAV